MTIEATGSAMATQALSLLGDASGASFSGALTPEAIMMLLERRLDDTDGQIAGVMHQIEENTARSEAIQRKVEGLQLLKTAMANKESDSGKAVSLNQVTVEWNGKQITGVELLNELGITDLSTESGMPVDPNGLTAAEREEKEAELADLEAQIDDAEIAWYTRTQERLADAPNKRVKRRLERRLKRCKRRIERRKGVDIDNLISQRDALKAQLDPTGESGVYKEDTKVSGAALDSYIQQLQSQARRANSGNEMLMIQMRSAMSQREQSVTMVKSMLDTMYRNLQKLAQW